MKVVVLKEFYDKDNLRRLFKVGEVLDFDVKRAKDVISRGLAKAEEKTVEVAPKPVVKPVVEKAEPVAPKEDTPKKEEAPVVVEPKRRGRPAKVSE